MSFFAVSGQLLGAATQRVITRETHHKRNRLQHQQKDGPKNDMAVKPTQGMPQSHPPLVGLPQCARSNQAQAESWDRNPQRPAVKTMASQCRQEPPQQKRKSNGKEQAELTELLGRG